jgi:hypothetical protein
MLNFLINAADLVRLSARCANIRTNAESAKRDLLTADAADLFCAFGV